MINEEFSEYMAYFKTLPLKEKQGILIDQLKLLSTLTNQLCHEVGSSNEVLVNRELLDMSHDNYSEDDFAEALIVLVNSVQNSICDFCDKISSNVG